MRSFVLKLVKPIHARLRAQKVGLFFEVLSNGGQSSLLDVGGALGITCEFEPLYARFLAVTVANLDPPKSNTRFPGIQSLAADGCLLPFRDRSFDWVFSNAVIEHVGDLLRQQRFASEIQRVAARGYFVTTPNRYFPLEPHALLPFYQFLSPSWQRRALRFSPGYLREYEEIHLLSSRQMQLLFPEATIVSTGLGNSLVAYERFSSP